MSDLLDEDTNRSFDRLDRILLRAMGPELRACVPMDLSDEETKQRFMACMSRLLKPFLVHGSKENPEALPLELQERAFLFLQNQSLLKRALVAEARAEKLSNFLAGKVPPEIRELARRLADELILTQAKQDA